MKIRRVTVTGVQQVSARYAFPVHFFDIMPQLLLDTHGSSSVIEAMPVAAAAAGGLSSRPPADYVKMVRVHHARTDGVLKALLGDTEEQVLATAQQLVPDIVKGAKGRERLLEMKGLRPETPFDKVEQLREASAAIGQRLHDAATEAVRQVTLLLLLLLLLLMMMMIMIMMMMMLEQGSLPNTLAGMMSGDAVTEALNRLGRGR